MCEAIHVPFNCGSYDAFDLTNNRTILIVIIVRRLENRNDGCVTLLFNLVKASILC